MASRLLRAQVLRSLLENALQKQASFATNRQLLSCTLPTTQKCRAFSSSPGIIPRRAIADADIKATPDLLSGSDPDKFGDLIDDDHELADEGDKQEEDFGKNKPSKRRQLSTKQYADMIKEHLRYRRIKEAIDILEVRMLKHDRVQPENYIYNLVISGCAREGYTRKAFQLYNKMKQRDLKVTGGTYTSLFNACANAPSKEDGLGKANKLRGIMLEKGYDPNVSNYNAMIKAYGRCGDIQTAFVLADEMTEKRLAVGVETYNFLLQACASDAELGFRHALLIWHKMLRRKIMPDKYSFNLMLRIVRDCSVGDLAALEDVITKILAARQPLPLLSDPSKVSTINEEDNSLVINVVPGEGELDTTPNMLALKPHLGSLISISEIQRPEDRLLLLGGQTGFLEEMKKARITPGIQTFTLMLEVVPSTTAAEKFIISMIRKIGLKADIDFFNVLIKKRSMRFDYQGAKEVMSMIRTAKLQPDIVTYGVLALGCQSQDEARELLEEMQRKGVRMNIQILGAMLKQGAMQRNFNYILEILQITLDQEIEPNENFLRHLEGFQNSCFKLIRNSHPDAKSTSFRKNFTVFRNKYAHWQKEFNIDGLKVEDAITKLNGSAYNQFKEASEGGYEDIKNEKLQRKQKTRKYVRKLKVDALQDSVQEKDTNNKLPFEKSVQYGKLEK